MNFNKTCKYCGEQGLAWDNQSGKWILIDHYFKKHECAGIDVLSSDDNYDECDEIPIVNNLIIIDKTIDSKFDSFEDIENYINAPETYHFEESYG